MLWCVIPYHVAVRVKATHTTQSEQRGRFVWSLVRDVLMCVCSSPAYRSSGSPSRPWRHSVGLRPATAAASWCRSPAAAPASSPSPAWSHCHSQSSSLMSPPRNGPHRMGLHSGHDAWGGRTDRGKVIEVFIYTFYKWTFLSHLKDIHVGDKLKKKNIK